MTLLELLVETVDLCKKVSEDEQIGSDEKKIKEQIKIIAEGLREKSCDLEGEVDAKTRALLQDVIETGIGAPGIGYDSFEEMITKLSHIKSTHVLNIELRKYEDDLTVYSYEYAADQARFRSYDKACEGVLYVLESKKTKRDIAVLFTKDSIVFIKFKIAGVFQIANKLKVPYENIIGVCQGFESKENSQYIDIISGNHSDASTWKYNTFELGSIDDEIICNIMDKIICSIRNLETEKDIIAYYSDVCRQEYELPLHKVKIALNEQWKIITVLGEKAHQLSEECCKEILLTIYQRQKNRATLDGNKSLESFSRRRLLILTQAIGNNSKIRVRINDKRQLTIPEKIYETLDFKDEAELIYEDGKLYISPNVVDEEDKPSELLLEELVGMGLEGKSLVKYFKLGATPAEGEVEADEEDDEAEDPIAALKAGTAQAKEKAKKPRRSPRVKKEDKKEES